MAADKAAIEREARRYLQLERLKEHRDLVENLLAEGNWEQLGALVGRRLAFGTAGIRGQMGPGFGQMNDLVIIQTSQGLASYLLESNGELALKGGVIIGFDARHNSARFARLAALAFLQKAIPVHLIDYICPTPLVAFGVRRYACAAGIVVTASHNPKQDNGYKVFWANGAQILSPHDSQIQDHIMMDDNQCPWPLAWRHELLVPPASGSGIGSLEQPAAGWLERKLLLRSYKDLTGAYYDYIDSMLSDSRKRLNQDPKNGLCITYTTMHGVGHAFLTRALELAGFEDIFPVQLQKKPDPEFSTVKFPNPEEAGALELAFETAKHANSNLILANDPDADRCAAGLFEPKSGRRRVLTGNELGSLLGWWLWHSYTNLESPSSSDEELRAPSDCYMISTAVSSKFLYSMALAEGFHFVETLTGFKFMGNAADTLIRERKKKVLFAYEEAIGYMCNSRILDKDGISAAVQLASCAAYLAREFNRTLEQQLDWLYALYGYHYNLNSYYLCSDPQIIGKIFAKLQANYPGQFTSEFKVTRVRDLNKNFDSSTRDNKCELPTSSSSQMITFFVNDNITLTIRTSGTEPKIKYYSEIVAKLPALPALKRPTSSDKLLGALSNKELNSESQLKAKEAARNKLARFVQLAIERCLEPAKYDLEPAD